MRATLSNGQGNLHPTTTTVLPNSQHLCSLWLLEDVTLAATVIAALKGVHLVSLDVG